jgi:hypothetical protein
MAEQQRRLSDKILGAFHHACDNRDADVAEQLLRALELALTTEGGLGRVDQRENMGPVVEAYTRLRELRRRRLQLVVA